MFPQCLLANEAMLCTVSIQQLLLRRIRPPTKMIVVKMELEDSRHSKCCNSVQVITNTVVWSMVGVHKGIELCVPGPLENLPPWQLDKPLPEKKKHCVQ